MAKKKITIPEGAETRVVGNETWFLSKGKGWVNSNTGKVLKPKDFTVYQQNVAPISTAPAQASAPNMTFLDLSGLKETTGMGGTGNALWQATQRKLAEQALGKKNATEGISAEQLFLRNMPLLGVDPSLMPEAQAALRGLASISEQVATRDPNQLAAIEGYRRNWEEGLGQPALTGLREEGLEQINQGLQSALRQLQLSNAGRGLGGSGLVGAGTALDKALAARRALERDIFNADVTFRQTGLQNFANFSNKVNNDYLSNLTTATNNYWTGANTAQDWIRNQQLFNIAQQEKYGAGKLGALFGGGATGQARDNIAEVMRLYKEGLAAMKSPTYSYSGSGTGTSSQGSNWAGSAYRY